MKWFTQSAFVVDFDDHNSCKFCRPGSFKIWDEPDESEDAELESDSSENSDDFKS